MRLGTAATLAFAFGTILVGRIEGQDGFFTPKQKQLIEDAQKKAASKDPVVRKRGVDALTAYSAGILRLVSHPDLSYGPKETEAAFAMIEKIGPPARPVLEKIIPAWEKALVGYFGLEGAGKDIRRLSTCIARGKKALRTMTETTDDGKKKEKTKEKGIDPTENCSIEEPEFPQGKGRAGATVKDVDLKATAGKGTTAFDKAKGRLERGEAVPGSTGTILVQVCNNGSRAYLTQTSTGAEKKPKGPPNPKEVVDGPMAKIIRDHLEKL